MSAEDDRQVISVLMTPNERYAQHAAACIASLLRHSTARFDFVIASTDDPAGFAERISRSFAGNDRVSLEYRQFQLPAHTHFPVVNNLSLDAYLRFWVDELLVGRSRAIYLDPDIIAVGPIDELWETDLQQKVVGPCRSRTRCAFSSTAWRLAANSLIRACSCWTWTRGGAATTAAAALNICGSIRSA